MHDAKDKRALVFDAVHNHALPHGQAAVSGAEVFLAGTTDIGEAGEREETVCDGVDEALRGSRCCRFPWQRITRRRQDQLRRGGLRDASSAGGSEFGKKAGASAFLHFGGKLLH